MHGRVSASKMEGRGEIVMGLMVGGIGGYSGVSDGWWY
jgi:hypothetical protein